MCSYFVSSIIVIVIKLFFAEMFPVNQFGFLVNVFVITEDGCMIEVVASADSELRLLVLEGTFFTCYFNCTRVIWPIISNITYLIYNIKLSVGVSMLSSITGKFYHDEEEVLVVQQLEDMYEVRTLFIYFLCNPWFNLSSITCKGNISYFLQKLVKRFEHTKHNLEKNLGSNKFAVSEANSSTCCSYSTELLCQKSGFNSWRDTLPLVDITSIFLDMELLEELSSVVLVDSKGLHLVSF